MSDHHGARSKRKDRRREDQSREIMNSRYEEDRRRRRSIGREDEESRPFSRSISSAEVPQLISRVSQYVGEITSNIRSQSFDERGDRNRTLISDRASMAQLGRPIYEQASATNRPSPQNSGLQVSIREQNKLAQEKNQLQQERDFLLYEKNLLLGDLGTVTSENEELRRANKELAEKQIQYEVDIQNAQKISSRRLAETIWVPDEDRTTRDKLDQLHDDIRSWSRDHSLASIDDVENIDPGDKDMLFQQLTATVKITDGRLPLALKAPRTFTKAPYLLLTSALTAEIYRNLFENVFFFFNDEDDVERIPTHQSMPVQGIILESPSSKLLLETYYQISEYNASEAHLWRAILFRILLHQQDPGGHESTGKGSELANRRIKNISKLFALALESGPLHLLLRQEKPAEQSERSEALRSIIERAAWLFIKLRTQRTEFKLDESKNYLGQRFEVRSDVMKADKLHRLEDDDRSMDGGTVDIVVFPVILGFGDSSGGRLDTSRVLSKAVVWVGGPSKC